MIFDTIVALQVIAEIIGVILFVLQPFVVPIGQVMVFFVNYILELGIFPYGSFIFYIVLFVIFVVAGVIVNTSLIGDKLKDKFNKYDEKHFKKYSKHIPEDAEDAFSTIDKKKRETDKIPKDIPDINKDKQTISADETDDNDI
ncbi:MAG: hypothetical protein ACFFBP_03685 [Promethearchaeota archaeon]